LQQNGSKQLLTHYSQLAGVGLAVHWTEATTTVAAIDGLYLNETEERKRVDPAHPVYDAVNQGFGLTIGSFCVNEVACRRDAAYNTFSKPGAADSVKKCF
jgi:hypothetical protein